MSAKKNLGLVLLAGITGYLVYRQSLKAQESAWTSITAPVPQPGTSGLGALGAMPRARLSSRGGTNMLAGLPGVWVPESSSWDKPSTQNNGVYGLGSTTGMGIGDLGRFSFKKAANIAKTVAISAIPVVGPSLALKAAVKTVPMPPAVKKIATVAAAISMPVVGPAQVTQKMIATRGNALISLPHASGRPQASTQPVVTKAPDGTEVTTQQTIYQDANGNVITEDQYNQLIALQQQQAAVQQPIAAPVAQSASVTNASPVSYSQGASDTGAPAQTPQGNIIMPDGTVLDASGNPIAPASGDTSAQPTGRFDGQASGGTDTSTPNADASANTPSGGGKVALLVAAVGAGAFFLFKK